MSADTTSLMWKPTDHQSRLDRSIALASTESIWEYILRNADRLIDQHKEGTASPVRRCHSTPFASK